MMKETLSFKIVTGINEGYFHNNEGLTTEKQLGNLWQYIALNFYNRTGMYIAANIIKSNTVYNTEWGCPIGGEDTYTITGVANPEFIPAIRLNSWEEGVIEISNELKKKLKQSTMSIEFIKTRFVYLVDTKEE